MKSREKTTRSAPPPPCPPPPPPPPLPRPPPPPPPAHSFLGEGASHEDDQLFEDRVTYRMFFWHCFEQETQSTTVYS